MKTTILVCKETLHHVIVEPFFFRNALSLMPIIYMSSKFSVAFLLDNEKGLKKVC